MRFFFRSILICLFSACGIGVAIFLIQATSPQTNDEAQTSTRSTRPMLARRLETANKQVANYSARGSSTTPAEFASTSTNRSNFAPATELVELERIELQGTSQATKSKPFGAFKQLPKRKSLDDRDESTQMAHPVEPMVIVEEEEEHLNVAPELSTGEIFAGERIQELTSERNLLSEKLSNLENRFEQMEKQQTRQQLETIE